MHIPGCCPGRQHCKVPCDFLLCVSNRGGEIVSRFISVPKGGGLKLSSHCSLSWQSEIRYVDGSAIVEWDIIASNGIIHVISEPLKAPPAHVST